jgi:hypothetical protein
MQSLQWLQQSLHETDMKIPYNCPYCIQTCSRRWNLTTHIERKHSGRFNPFYKAKKIVFTALSYQAQNNPHFSNSFFPQYDYSDPTQIERLTRFNNLLQEIKQLSKMEVNYLLYEINNFHFSWLVFNSYSLRNSLTVVLSAIFRGIILLLCLLIQIYGKCLAICHLRNDAAIAAAYVFRTEKNLKCWRGEVFLFVRNAYDLILLYYT